MASQIELSNLAQANPSPLASNMPQTPNTNPPEITLNTPRGNQTFEENTPIPYSITIKIPSAWFENQTDTSYCSIKSISYFLSDNNAPTTLAGEDLSIGAASGPIVKNEKGELVFVPSFSANNPTINLNGTLPALPIGRHGIVASVVWSSNYHPTDTPHNFYGWQAAVYEASNITYTSNVNFDVVNQQTGTLPSAESNNQQSILILVVTVVGIIAVLAVSLAVFFKKRNSNNQK